VTKALLTNNSTVLRSFYTVFKPLGFAFPISTPQILQQLQIFPNRTLQWLHHPLYLQPVLRLQTCISEVRHLPANEGVSYGLTYRSPHPTTIATLPIGYGDGWSRALSNKAACLIRGTRFPLVGAICMDETLVITAEDLAQWAETIPYEILAALNTRIPRIYVESFDHSEELSLEQSVVSK